MLVPRTPPELAGTTSIQEASMFEPLHEVGREIYDATFALTDVREMPRIAIALRHLFARPQGAVVQLSMPTDLLTRRCPSLRDASTLEITRPAPSVQALARVAEWLDRPGGPPLFVLGSGAVPYHDLLAEAIARLGAVHVTTPSALGLLPDSLGLIGNGASTDVAALVRDLDPRCTFLIGTRLGMASGGTDATLLPSGCPVVHVDVAPEAAVASAPAVRGHPLLSIPSDIGEFLGALDELAPPR